MVAGGDDSLLIEWTTAASLVPLGIAVALVIGTGIWRRGCWGVGRAIALIVVAGVAWLGGSLGDPFSGWGLGEEFRASDGHVYRPCGGWWSVGAARHERSEWDREVWRPVVIGATDSPRRFALLVRPENRSPEALVETSDGLLVVVGEARCYAAYDLERDVDLTRDELSRLSPFALLRDDETGLETDVADLEVALREAQGQKPDNGTVVRPDEAELLDELDSENAWVRESAARLLVAGGNEAYPRGFPAARDRSAPTPPRDE